MSVYAYFPTALGINSPFQLQAAVPASNALALRDLHFPLLARGINLAGWADDNTLQPTLKANENYIGDSDLRVIRELGFSHVRIPLDPRHFLEPMSPIKLNEPSYQVFSRMVQKVLLQGLGVVVDMHPNDPDTKRKLATDDRYVSDYAALWSNLASRLSSLDQDRIFFEPLNEPGFQNFVANPEQRWNDVQNRLVRAIRSNAPNNTVIVTSFNWDSMEGIPKIAGVNDPNVIYDIHYYAPLAFTHQGATWSGPGYAQLHHLPYPNEGRAEQVDRVLPLLPEDAKKLARGYKANPYTAEDMARDFAPVVDWARANNAKLYLGEFGVLKKRVGPVDRAQWIADVRQLCERNGIGWGMWEYDQEFGLAHNINGKRTFDPLVTKALGLNDALATDPARVLFHQTRPVGAVSSNSPLPRNRLVAAS